MPDNESPALDSKDWEIVFRAYEEYPALAFILAQYLLSVKTLSFIRGPWQLFTTLIAAPGLTG